MSSVTVKIIGLQKMLPLFIIISLKHIQRLRKYLHVKLFVMYQVLLQQIRNKVGTHQLLLDIRNIPFADPDVIGYLINKIPIT